MSTSDNDGRKESTHSNPVTGEEARSEREFLNRVRDGVRRFILDKITVDEYKRTYRDTYSHPLTRSALLRIIDAATGRRSPSDPDEDETRAESREEQSATKS